AGQVHDDLSLDEEQGGHHLLHDMLDIPDEEMNLGEAGAAAAMMYHQTVTGEVDPELQQPHELQHPLPFLALTPEQEELAAHLAAVQEMQEAGNSALFDQCNDILLHQMFLNMMDPQTGHLLSTT
ncbi:unnamed protein product, partial [Amoebophrya sp. A25]